MDAPVIIAIPAWKPELSDWPNKRPARLWVTTNSHCFASVAANLVVDRQRQFCVGQEVNANHIRSVRKGTVTGVARPFHLGRTSQIWGIELSNDAGERTCVARLTIAVVTRNREEG
jgi:acyl-coenzyme A thioesterase PaaI-like protein